VLCSLTAAGCVSYRFVRVPTFHAVSIAEASESSAPSVVAVELMQAGDRKLYLDIIINGSPRRALIDTGAYPTFFDKGTVEEIGVKVKITNSFDTNAGEMYTGIFDSLKIGGMEFKGYSFWSLDLAKERKMHAKNGLPDFAVLLGSDFLAHFRAKVDNENKCLILKMPDPAVSASAQGPPS